MGRLSISLLPLLFLVASPTFAESYDPETPLLYKQLTSGFGPEGQISTLTCQIFSDRFKMVKRGPGRHLAITMKALSVPPEVLTKIKEASEGPLSFKKAPADIGHRVYAANLIGPLETQTVDLGRTIDGKHISTNSHPSAALLKKYIDRTCRD